MDQTCNQIEFSNLGQLHGQSAMFVAYANKILIVKTEDLIQTIFKTFTHKIVSFILIEKKNMIVAHCENSKVYAIQINSEISRNICTEYEFNQKVKCISMSEKLSENDPWYCNKCKKHQLATKKFDLWKLPDVLIIHLKRFSYTQYHREKINSKIHFPLTDLQLSDFCTNPEMKDSNYDLFAVSNHMGGLGGGHYTAYAKNFLDKKWYELNDSRVSPIDEDRVESRIISSSAYVLFYGRKQEEEDEI